MTVHPDDVVLYALGERVAADVATAIETDPAHRREVAELRRVLQAGRAVTPEDHRPDAPPERLWARIEHEALGDTTDVAGVMDHAGVIDADGASGTVRGVARRQPKDEAAPPPPDRAARRPDHADRSPRPSDGPHRSARPSTRTGRVPRPSPRAARSWRRMPVIAVAAAILGVAAVGVAGVVLRSTTPETLVAAQLEPLRGQGGGAAEVRAGDDGRVLVARTERLPSTPGYYEVWLIDPESLDMVSLGPIRDDASYPVPEGLDLDRFALVDVSAEPLDGDPTHSGDSLLRGLLDEPTRS